MAKSKTRNGKSHRLNEPATAVKFRAAARAYTLKTTRSRATAVKSLQREGILTPKGRFTKPYAS